MLIRWKSKDKASTKTSTIEASGCKKKRKFGKDQEDWNTDRKSHCSDEGDTILKLENARHNDHTSGRIRATDAEIGGYVSGSAFQHSGSVIAGRTRDESRRRSLNSDNHPFAVLHHQQVNAAVATVASQPMHSLEQRHVTIPHCGAVLRRSVINHEMAIKARQRKPSPRGFLPLLSSTMLYDDDPGIMSEVETSSTGFRRGGKQRSSLPIVRTPSKTLERPLGLVFLQYRSETKRALLPNEVTSIDTVKALFVRSFPKQLSMEYLDSPVVKIYIHDSNKDMFYELEDLRSHLRDIRDRSILRLFESDGVSVISEGHDIRSSSIPPSQWDDQNYFSEPEFDSEFKDQHIHKSKNTKNTNLNAGYYMNDNTILSRRTALLRSYSPVLPGTNTTDISGSSQSFTKSDQLHAESGYTHNPLKNSTGDTILLGSSGSSCNQLSTTSSRNALSPYITNSSYEDPYYSQYSGSVTPVIDEEARIRVEHMERQLASLTGLVQKALTHAPHPSPPKDYLQVPVGQDALTRSPDNTYTRTDIKPPKLGKDKSVSFEKSVSFSDEPPDMNSPKQHSPQHTADTKPTKPAIKSSTLPRMSSQEKERYKPIVSPKPLTLDLNQYVYRDLALTPEMYNHLRNLQKKAKDLRQEFKNLRRMSQAQAHSIREIIRDSFSTIRTMLLSSGNSTRTPEATEIIRLNKEGELYKQEMLWLEKDLTGLESTVEELRGNVINRKTRVNMSDVENMALILNKASKTVADLKVRFPNLQQGMKSLLSSEMEKVIKEEKFLKEEPDRLETALKRCKKLTGTLVTLKRLASVQEQRLPNSGSMDIEETAPAPSNLGQSSKEDEKALKAN